MDSAEIRARVVAVFVDQLGIDEVEAVDEAKLGDDLGADSLDGVEIELELEERFGFVLSDADEDSLRREGVTVRDVLDLVGQRLGEK